MTQYITKEEDKNLIRRDVCARLMAGVILSPINPEDFDGLHTIIMDMRHWDIYSSCEVLQSIPFLRKTSSMTYEEIKEYDAIRFDKTLTMTELSAKIIDFYISHYIDFRGLIERGLAREDTKRLYERIFLNNE